MVGGNGAVRLQRATIPANPPWNPYLQTNLPIGQYNVSAVQIEDGRVYHSRSYPLSVTQAPAVGVAQPAVGVAQQGNQQNNNACFAAETLLHTGTSLKPIEQFRVGDPILSRSEWNPHGELEIKLVEEVFEHSAKIIHLHINGKLIRSTAEHPFWVNGKGSVAAEELQSGNSLLSDDGQLVAVEEVYDTGEWEKVFNLRISDYHTYFVGGWDWGFSVWAHNMCVYRAGTAGQQNLTPRPGDVTGLSTFDSIPNLMAASAASGHPIAAGSPIQVIDTDRLAGTGLSAVADPPPIGHVSIRPGTQPELDAWIASRLPNPESAYTLVVRAAIVRVARAP